MLNNFVGYVGPPEIHDAVIQRVVNTADTVTVFIASDGGHEFGLRFHGVTHQNTNSPEKMMLYSLSEMRCDPPSRKFVFVNWEEDDPAQLEIFATGFDVLSAL